MQHKLSLFFPGVKTFKTRTRNPIVKNLKTLAHFQDQTAPKLDFWHPLTKSDEIRIRLCGIDSFEVINRVMFIR